MRGECAASLVTLLGCSMSTLARRGNPEWVKGGPSPNPKGMRPLTPKLREAIHLAREWAPKGVEGLIELATQRADLSVALRAHEYLLNRVYGQPSQAIQLDSDAATPAALASQAAMLAAALASLQAAASNAEAAEIRAAMTVLEANGEPIEPR